MYGIAGYTAVDKYGCMDIAIRIYKRLMIIYLSAYLPVKILPKFIHDDKNIIYKKLKMHRKTIVKVIII